MHAAGRTRAGAPAFRAALALALLGAWLGACSGVTPYRDAASKNLYVHRDTADNVSAAVHVYRVDGQCRPDYRGTVELDGDITAVGLPTGKRLLLDFVFTTSTFLGASTHRIGREVLLTPRAGSRYEAHARYRDDIYQVTLAERRPRDRAARGLALNGLERCRPAQ